MNDENQSHWHVKGDCPRCGYPRTVEDNCQTCGKSGATLYMHIVCDDCKNNKESITCAQCGMHYYPSDGDCPRCDYDNAQELYDSSPDVSMEDVLACCGGIDESLRERRIQELQMSKNKKKQDVGTVFMEVAKLLQPLEQEEQFKVVKALYVLLGPTVKGNILP